MTKQAKNGVVIFCMVIFWAATGLLCLTNAGATLQTQTQAVSTNGNCMMLALTQEQARRCQASSRHFFSSDSTSADRMPSAGPRSRRLSTVTIDKVSVNQAQRSVCGDDKALKLDGRMRRMKRLLIIASLAGISLLLEPSNLFR